MKTIRVGAPRTTGWGEATALEPRFAPLVERLEQLAGVSPRGHGYRVLAAGLLGYVVLAAILLGLLAIALGIVAFFVTHPAGAGLGIKLLIPIGAVMLSQVAALRVATPALDGHAVTRGEAPALHRLVDDLRATTDGPAIHEIRITNEMNAGIAQYPRLLVLPSRNILFVGLPLLQVLSRPEVEAVIAHEMGHFVGGHGRTTAFVYRIRTRWSQLGQRLPTGIVAGGLRRFFDWYGPWFAAYSFVLARRQEYEADALSARIVGPTAAGHALIRIACQSARWHEGWTTIWEQAVQRPDPPSSPYRLLGEAALGDWDEAASAVLADALARTADLGDTHPGLSQRLAALGVTPQLPPPLVEAAAPALLGPALADMLDRLDADWRAAADASWADEFADRQDMLAERQSLESQAAAGVLDYDGQHRLAQLIEQLDGPVQGAAAFADILTRFPEAHGTRYRHGEALLDTGDEAGIAPMLAAAQAVPELESDALWRILRYARGQGRDDLIATFEPRLDAVLAAEEETRLASSIIDESVQLRPLDAQEQQDLTARTADVAGVKWLVAAKRDLPPHGQPQIVFVFATRGRHSGAEVLDTLIAAITPVGDMLGIEHSRPRHWLTKRLRDLPTSRIQG